MPEILDERTRAALSAYMRSVKTLPNESGKRHRFSALLGELFPNQKILDGFTRGMEKLIRIEAAAGKRRGFADAYHRDVVIEFEASLDQTLASAEEQLREYTSGLWNENQHSRPLTAIASDGIVWRIYATRADTPTGRSTPADVTLVLRREFSLSEANLGEFWMWLNQVLFRPQQIPATAEWFQHDFGSGSDAYHETLVSLQAAWAAARQQPEAALAFATWQKYLTVTYGKLSDNRGDRLQTLFLKHSYLCSLARLLVWAALSKGEVKGSLRDAATSVLSGRYFESRGFANLVEDDFFHWIRQTDTERALAGAWERVLSLLLQYDLSTLGQDVLKGVYQQLIDPEDRHDLGEYYTPDWLCERIVSQTLPAAGFPTVLDPSCGSGSFLRAAIAHLRAANPQAKGEAALKKILESVQGIDIHPVAVTIARATYVLALGPLARAAHRPIQIPVYLADSLFLPHEVEENLLNKLRGIEITYGQGRRTQKVVIPDDLIRTPKLFDEAISACSRVAEDHARTSEETLERLGRYLSKEVPDPGTLLGHDAILDALWEFTAGLAALIRARSNSIWAFIVRNSYRPAMLRGQFDFILGNPPWLAYRYIDDPEYQAEVKKRAVVEYAIAPKSQKLFTQMELATVFFAHAMAVFSRPGGRIAFVMPRSVLSADQHQNLIKRSHNAPFRLTGYWDLDNVSPLFNVPSCVLIACKDNNRGDPADPIIAEIWEGRVPVRNVSWPVAAKTLTCTKAEARTIYLGSRCALSTEAGALEPAKASPYQKAFRQGATIVPRSFYFVRAKGLDGAPDSDRTYWIETDPEQAREAKPPYKDVRLSGPVEGRFLFSAAIAKHILPFTVVNPATVVLPIETDGAGIHVRTASTLTNAGYRDAGKWFQQAESIWTELRGAKADRQNLYQRLDYQRGLTAQDLRHRHLVLYNAAGTNLTAAHFDRETTTLPLLIEHKLYWFTANTAAEAHYLASLLNSEPANRAIKPFQSRGLLGERDIEKKALDLPLPHFELNDPTHARLAEIGAQAAANAQRALPDLPATRSLGRRRTDLRQTLAPLLAEIDTLAQRLLGA